MVLIEVYAFKTQLAQARNEQATDEIVLQITHFLQDQHEYQLIKNDRIFRDWQRNYEQITAAIDNFPTLKIRLEDELSFIKTSMNELAAMNYPDNEVLLAKEKALIDRNNIAARIILSRAADFSRTSNAAFHEKLRTARILEVVTVMLFIAIIIFLLYRFFINFSSSFQLMLHAIEKSLEEAIPKKKLLNQQELEQIKFVDLHTIAEEFNALLAKTVLFKSNYSNLATSPRTTYGAR